MGNLLRACLGYIDNGLTVGNVCELLLSAPSEDHSSAIAFIESNAAAVVRTPDWELMPADVVLGLAASNRLSIDEVDLFTGLVRWGKAESGRRGLGSDCSPAVLRRVKVLFIHNTPFLRPSLQHRL